MQCCEYGPSILS
jgi:hypothetical protein